MTKREFYTVIIEANIDENTTAFAQNELEKLDAANARAAAKKAEKRVELEPILTKIYDEMLSDVPISATMVGERLEISAQKATPMLRELVNRGKAASTEMKGPKGKIKGYIKL